MYSGFERVTPAIATDILTNHNAHNRPILPARVRSYAREMLENRWKANPQGIAFGVDGQLQNGQHTLAAIVQSGRTLNLYVHRECPLESASVQDQGLARTAAQTFAQLHGKSGTRYTAPARAVLEHGLNTSNPTHSAVVEWASNHMDVLEQYMAIGRSHTAGTHAAFVFAELAGLKYVPEAAKRLTELRWEGDDDPMRALARALGNMGARDGAKSKQARFFTTLGALQYVDAGQGLTVARKYDAMPTRVRESVRPEMAA
jgi:hypothetical protein